jgi:hypothetical protein
VDAISRPHFPLDQPLPFLDLEKQVPGIEIDRLVLEIVILQAEGVPRLTCRIFPTYRSVLAQCSS